MRRQDITKKPFPRHKRDLYGELGIRPGEAPTLEKLEKHARIGALRRQIIGPYSEILNAVRWLRENDLPRSIKTKRRKLFSALAEVKILYRDLFGVPEGEWRRLREGVAQAIGGYPFHLKSYHALYSVAKSNKKILSKAGWKLSKDGIMKPLRASANKFEAFFNEVVRHCAKRLDEKQIAMVPADRRKLIADILMPFFPEDWLRTRQTDLIGTALRNRK